MKRSRTSLRSIKKIFISYSRKDVDVVKPLTSLLRVTGARVFRDEDSIEPGKRWRIVLASSIKDANIMIVFWSKNSASSDYVAQEYREAIKNKIDVIPVLLDDTSLTSALQEYQYIDFQKFLCLPSPFDTVLRAFGNALLERMDINVEPFEAVESDHYELDLLLFSGSSNNAQAKIFINELKARNIKIHYIQVKSKDDQYISDYEFHRLFDSKLLATIISKEALSDEWLSTLFADVWAMQRGMISFLVDCQPSELPGNVAYFQSIPFEKRSIFMDGLIPKK